jgi:acyl-CoA thioesterase FadM
MNIPVVSYKKDFLVHLNETSSYGVVYYVGYHYWTALTKEEFFLEKVPNFNKFFPEQNIKLLVIDSALKIIREIKLHDRVQVYLYCEKLKRISADLKYVIISDNQVVAHGFNKIIFMQDDKIIIIPEIISKALKGIVK